jgi:hypothetical protein
MKDLVLRIIIILLSSILFQNTLIIALWQFILVLNFAYIMQQNMDQQAREREWVRETKKASEKPENVEKSPGSKESPIHEKQSIKSPVLPIK